MSADEPAPGTSFPRRMGRYRLLAPIGRGGMATVYLGEAEGLGGFKREVAVKVLHEHLRADPSLVAQFIEEAKLAARIRHPNVVAVSDVAADEFGVHLVMEHVDGDSLAGLYRAATAAGQALPTPVAMRILTDALAGLHAAHELTDEDGSPLELVHRDFSPQNILVGLDGIARLTDFGVAKLAARQGHTQSGVIKGKVRYMSPEQVRGAPLNRRSDIWAAGVVAWEILSRRRMYRSKDDVATMFEIVTHVPPRLSTVRAGVSAELDTVIATALAPNADERFSTAEQFRGRLLASLPVAEIEEVARCVRELTGKRLATRRIQIRSLPDSGGRLELEPALEGSGSGPAANAASASASLSRVGEHGDATLTTSSSPIASRWRPPRGRSLLAASLGLGGLVLGYAYWTKREGPTAPVASAPSPVVATEAAPSAEKGDALAPTAPVREPGLRVTANAPISAVSLDGQRHEISPPAREARVPRPATGGPVRVVVTAADGRSTASRMEPGAESLDVEFAAAGKPRATKPRVGAPAPKPPVLAPWPTAPKP